MAELGELQQKIKVSFKEPALLEQALLHMSYINENSGNGKVSNERMEFLGDAVLGLVIAEKLYHDFPELDEGEMTRLRAAVVSRDTLARIARTVNLGDFLYLGKGEEASGGRSKPSNLARALEAVIAAIFLDQGLGAARDFILELFGAELEKAINQDAGVDYKSRLQELMQSERQQTPTYRIVEVQGPDHAREFTVEVMVGKRVLGQGKGRSKKTAEEEAARFALDRLPG